MQRAKYTPEFKEAAVHNLGRRSLQRDFFYREAAK